MEIRLDKEAFLRVVEEGLKQMMPHLINGYRLIEVESPNKYSTISHLAELRFETNPVEEYYHADS